MDERLKTYGPEIILMFALVIVYYMKRSYENFSDTNFWMYVAAICGAYMYYKNKTPGTNPLMTFTSTPTVQTTPFKSGEIPPFR